MKTLLGAATFIFFLMLGVLAGLFNFEPAPQKEAISKSQYIDHKRQIACLADNIYYEAGNQSITGKKAVAYVTLNRMRNSNWPSDVCQIVYQRTVSKELNKTICQFSWVCEQRRSKNDTVWEQSYNIARHVWYKYDASTDPTNGATYFHATYVRPQWNYQKTIQIGDHIFYK